MTSKLLIVDDSLSVRKAIERILGPQGHQTRSAASLAAARAALGAETPDLVLCDLILPDGDGIELVSELRGKGVPVLCISAVVDGGVRERVAAAGAAGLLAKPFTPAEMLAAVATQLGGNGAQAPAHAPAAPRRQPAIERSLEAAKDWAGLVFAVVTAPEGGELAGARGVSSSGMNEGRTAELLQLGRRMASELRSGTVQSMVLEAYDARLIVELLPEGEVLVICVSSTVLLGMALLYARRIHRPVSPLSRPRRSFGEAS